VLSSKIKTKTFRDMQKEAPLTSLSAARRSTQLPAAANKISGSASFRIVGCTPRTGLP